MDFNDVRDILGSLEIVERIHQLTAIFVNDEINNHVIVVKNYDCSF